MQRASHARRCEHIYYYDEPGCEMRLPLKQLMALYDLDQLEVGAVWGCSARREARVLPLAVWRQRGRMARGAVLPCLNVFGLQGLANRTRTCH